MSDEANGLEGWRVQTPRPNLLKSVVVSREEFPRDIR